MRAGLLATLAVAGAAHASASRPLALMRPVEPLLDVRWQIPGPLPAAATPPATPAAQADPTPDRAARMRDTLVGLALALRDVRYVRGGSSPSTGFDCSGFVRYVFARATGLQLPGNSASQFRAGARVARDRMQPGDLVFFRTHGRGRVSHVGIYLAHGRFIHAPSPGKSVEVSSLEEAYWARRFAGARRPGGIAQSG